MAREKDKIGVYAEIARVWEDKIGNEDIAIKSWQKVISTDALFLEGYDRLMALFAKAEQYDQQIETGRAKVEQLRQKYIRQREREIEKIRREHN